MLSFHNVSFAYKNSDVDRGTLNVLSDVNYTFEPGKLYAIEGPSGSGKSTLLTLAAGLDNPKAGTIELDGKDIKKIGYTKYRRKIAVVFQSFNLINYMNAVQNVVTALDIDKVKGNRKTLAKETLQKLGIEEHQAKRNVLKLSGGQQQRVAIARALACGVNLILADEPTGSLDAQTADEITRLLQAIAHQDNKCVITVTHSRDVAAAADVVLTLKNGRLVEV